MLFAKLVRNRFRFAVVCLTVMSVAGITIAGGRKKDNLYPVIEALEKKADEVLTDPDHRQGTLLNALNGLKDRTSTAPETFFYVLLDRLQKTKEAIETEAAKRSTLSIDNDGTQVLAEVSARYLLQQRRILLNRFRGAHELTGDEARFNATDYDRYNLILPNNAGLAIAQNEQYGLRLNVWHVSRAGQYDHVELGLNPQDKNDAEESVLRETVTEDRYAKLIQLMSIRERTVNHWSIQRMSKPGVLWDPNLNSCGSNLVSFARGQNSQKTGYYDFLSKYDEYEEFLRKLKGGLPASTFDMPILTKEETAKLYRKFFYSLPEFETAKMMVDDSVLQNYLDHQVPGFSQSKIEALWKDKGDAIILLSSYPADSWKAVDVADRISWIAWETRKTFLIAQMAGEAQSQGMAAMAKSEDQVRQLAEKAAGSYLNLQRETAWREEVKKRVVAYLGGADPQSIDLQAREARFQDIFELSWPGIKNGSEAIYVKGAAKAAAKANMSAVWDNDIYRKVNSFYLYSDHDAGMAKASLVESYRKAQSLQAFMSAGLMKRRIYPWTPDQLSQFFYKKLAYMIEQKEFRGISKHAEKIAKSRVVMKGVEKMFGKISEAYMNRLKAAKVNPAEVPANSDYLYMDLRSVIKDSFAEFDKMISTPPPAPKITPTPKPKNPMLEYKMPPPVAVDNTRVYRPRPIEFKPPTDYVSGAAAPGKRSPRDEAKELFINAVSIMGLAHSALNRVATTAPSDRFATATFAQIEANLKQAPAASAAQLKNAVIRSIYDQYLIADVIYGQMLSQHPILTIQFENKIKSPALLDLMANKGASKGTVDKTLGMSMLRQGIAVAARNQQNLVSEACRAQPFQKYNDDWRNVFRTAGTLRNILQNANSGYKAMDEKLMKSTRTWWETQLEDVIDPIAQLFFYASLIAMAVVFTPMVVGGIAGLVTVGSWTVGAAGAMQAVGLAGLAATEASGAFASVALAVGKQLLKTVVGKLVMWIFTAQIAVMGYVNCYELPAHLKYQLGVANSQIGIFSKNVMDRGELKQLSDVIFVKQVSTGIMAVLQAAFMAKPLIVGTKNLLGLTTEQALARSAAYEGNEALVQGLKQKTFRQLVDEHGMWTGTGKWMSQTTESLVKFGRITTLTPEAMQADLEKVMAAKMQKLFPTVESYEGIVGERLYGINESRKFLVKQIKQIRTQNPSTKTKFSNWMKNKMMKHIVGGKYWNVAMSERAKMLIAEDLAGTGVNQVRHATESELREFAIRAYEEDLYQSQMYWVQKLAVLKNFKDELAGEAAAAVNLIEGGASHEASSVVMKRFLETFSAVDLMQHQELLNWVLLKTSSNYATAKIRGWAGTTAEIREFKQIFKDHQTLMDELNRMKPKPGKVNPNGLMKVVTDDAASQFGNDVDNVQAKAAQAQAKAEQEIQDEYQRAYDEAMKARAAGASEAETQEKINQAARTASEKSAKIAPEKDWSKINTDDAEELVMIDVDEHGTLIMGTKPKSEAPKASRKSFKLFSDKLGFGAKK